MLVVSEQQTFVKLRIAPKDFAELCNTDEAAAMAYIIQLQGEREKVTSRAKKPKEPKDPNAKPAKRGRQSANINFDEL